MNKLSTDHTPPVGENSDTFAVRLRSLLTERGISGAQLSRELSCSQQAVSKWLRNGRIDEPHLRALAEHLQVDWLWLRYGDEVIKGRARSNSLSGMDSLRTETFQRLVLAEERLSMAVDAAILGTWEWQLSSNEVTLSERMAELLDIGSESCTVPMQRFMRAIHPGDVDSLQKTLEDAARNGAPFQLDVRVFTHDRNQRWLFFAGCFQTRRTAHASLGLGIAKDISGRKRVEENLRRERLAYQRLFENSDSLQVVIDTHGHIIRCNQRFETLLGYEAAEITGREFCEFLASCGKTRPHYPDFDFGNGTYPHHLPTEMYSKDGGPTHIDWYLGPLTKSRHHQATGHPLAAV